jgi:hypothetical protein
MLHNIWSQETKTDTSNTSGVLLQKKSDWITISDSACIEFEDK